MIMVGLLLVLGGVVTSCSPEQRLAHRLGVKKGEMERLLIKVDQDGKESIRYTKGYRILTPTVNGTGERRKAYEEVVDLKAGKFHGPYFTTDSSKVYYLRVLSVTPIPYVDFTIAQIHQATGGGDQVFLEKLNNIAGTCLAEKMHLAEALKVYPDDKDVRPGMVFTRKQELLSDLIPEAREFLKTAALFEVKVSGKVKYPNTILTELLQKLAEPTYHDHIRFAKVTVLKKAEKKSR